MNTKNEEDQYLDILRILVDKLENVGNLQQGPQEEPAVTIGATTMEFDLSSGRIPLLTTKELSFKNIVVELLWFLSGESRLDFMHQHNVHFWDAWATEEIASQYGLEKNDVGRIYGPNWIRWPKTTGGHINQISNLVKGLREHPQWRRWKVIAWNPEFIDSAFLAPCHGDFHCLLVDGKLELHHVQRSGDFFVGVPYNIASYAILLRMICDVTKIRPGKLVQFTSDTHLYVNCLQGAKEQLQRRPKEFPILKLKSPINKDLFDYSWPDNFEIIGYDPYPAIKVKVAL